MVAGIETNGSEATFASYQTPGWHRLGTTFNEEVTTRRMLELAKLDNWHLRKVAAADLLTLGGVGVEDKAFIVRDNPFDQTEEIIGMVGKNYKLHDNPTLLNFGDAVFDGGGRWESAGSIKGGSVVFATLVLPDSITIDRKGIADKVALYVLITTAHDGTASTTFRPTPTRVVCQNTLSAALAGHTASYVVRHNATLEGRVQGAREALKVSFDTFDAFQQEANKLFETAMTTNEFDAIVQAQFPNTGTKRGDTRRENVRNTFMELFTGSGEMPNTVKGITNTAWAGMNAVTAYYNHHVTTKGDGEGRNLIRMGLTNPKEQAQLISRVKEFAGV